MRAEDQNCDCCRVPFAACRVMAEIRERKAPGYDAMARYREKLAARLAELDREPMDVDRALEKAGVPYDARTALAAAYETDATRTADRFISQGDARFLLLLGDKGLGKTLAAARVCAAFARKYPWNSRPSGGEHVEPMLFVEASSLTRLSAFGAPEREYVDKLKRCGLLVLDDVGEEATQLGTQTLVDLAIHRHAKLRRTVLTGNMKTEDFKTRYGAPLADRIRSSGIVCALTGKSMRTKARTG